MTVIVDSHVQGAPLPVRGMWSDVDEATYHLDRESLSSSGAKLILRAPAHFRHQMDNPPERKQEFDFGTAAHRLVLGVGPDLVEFEYDREKVKAPKRTNAWAEKEQRVREAGGILLLPDEHATVLAMADRLFEHTLAMELFSEGQPEVSAYATDPETGVAMRGRFDWLHSRHVLDYKTSTTSEPEAFVRKAVDFGYDLQASFYLDLAALCGHPAKSFVHVVQEKTAPYLVTVIVLPPELIERGRALKRQALERYRDCLEANSWPGYLSDTEFATPAAPPWALRDLHAA